MEKLNQPALLKLCTNFSVPMFANGAADALHVSQTDPFFEFIHFAVQKGGKNFVLECLAKVGVEQHRRPNSGRKCADAFVDAIRCTANTELKVTLFQQFISTTAFDNRPFIYEAAVCAEKVLRSFHRRR